jgi:AAA15 family ATPase/GTPase
MIKSIKINNFKSLVGFECELNKFSCLIGLNGAGKSTILQALDFLSQLMRGDVESWLLSRQWDKSDLNSRLTSTSNITFTVIIEDTLYGEILWRASFNRKSLNCTQETVYHHDDKIFNVEDGKCNIWNYQESSIKHDSFPVVFKYSGSVLSSLIDSQLSPPLLALKNQLLQLKSLDLLACPLPTTKSRLK